MMSLREHLLPEPANCEIDWCKSHGVSSGRSTNSPLWCARCFLGDSSNAPATVQRTTLKRVDPSTGTNGSSRLKQSVAQRRPGVLHVIW